MLLSMLLWIGLQAPSAATPKEVRDYVIGPRDVVSVTVFNEPDLSRPYTVDSDGAIDFPLLGRVQAGGRTVRQLEEQLATQLADGYLIRPQVSIEVQEYRSQTIFITGEVRNQGTFSIKGNTTLTEALLQAGGVTASSAEEIWILHPKDPASAGGPLLPEDGAAERTRVSLKDVQSGKAARLVIRDGDTIYVPRAETFFITGEVRSPGMYVLQPGMTYLQAISIAGGASPRAALNRVRVSRVVNGKNVEVSVKLTDLVQPKDTIRIRARFF